MGFGPGFVACEKGFVDQVVAVVVVGVVETAEVVDSARRDF